MPNRAESCQIMLDHDRSCQDSKEINGNHERRAFLGHDRWVQCGEKGCDSCTKNQCSYNVKYVEGSEINGHFFEDAPQQIYANFI